MTRIWNPSISGNTRVCGVIGEPVRHSLSPIIHNAAFASLGMDWVYVAFPVERGQASAAIAAMRILAIEGLSVTMPHKDDVFASVDDVTERARALRTCNTVFWRDGALVGDSTDGAGAVDALQDRGVSIESTRFVVIGAGGAGRAVIAGLARASAAAISIVNRDPQRALDALHVGGPNARLASSDAEVADAVSTSTVIINATSLGMRPDDVLPVNPNLFRADHLVNDLIYHPAETPLLVEAQRRGCQTMNGTGMLLRQATLQFERWTGKAAPLDAMRSALDAELSRRAGVETGSE
jgi:shikimate dehydrogenase